tara:strand:- start:300 stop:479 length:180 start_codon:yes stop_codon:yes gene_type:complete
MNITEAKYFTNSDANNEWVRVTVDGEHSFVPLDPANRHYAEIMRQVEAGTLTIAPAEEE